jgi:hypothetical protein
MRTFVIAGSYHEFFAFLTKKGLPRTTREYVFFSDPTHLYSLLNVQILCVGTYQESPVYTFQYLDRYDQTLRGIKFVDETGQTV